MRASLASNNGNSELSITLVSKSEYGHELGYESSVKISSQHWDGDHEHPMCLNFDGLWLRRSDLMDVREFLVTWGGQPLRQLASAVLIAEFELARLPGQNLMLIFGPRVDTIDERKPVVTVKVRAGSLNADFHFVTDQSCLALFVDELAKI